MDKLVSSWYSTVESVPKNYVLPVTSRPGDERVPICNTTPVIDLNHHDRYNVVQQVLKACQEFGFFQVINHGVDDDVASNTMSVVKDFFMSNENKASFLSEDSNKTSKLFTSNYNYETEDIHFWRDNLRHHCYPIEESIHLWPAKPTRYRDVVGKYTLQMSNLSSTILELISKGLGIEPGYFDDRLTGAHFFSAHHYPPCPNPNLVLGLPKHCDPNIVTFVLQNEICGLQMYNNGEWVSVEPIPNAFVVIIGQQAQVISNGKIISPEHRSVTNSTHHRMSIAYSTHPKQDSIIEPAKVVIGDSHCPLYRSFQYKEFLETFQMMKHCSEAALDAFKNKV